MIAILARHSTLRDALFAVVKARFLRCVSFYVAVNAFSTLIFVCVHAFKAGIVIVATALLFALGFACLTLCITLFGAFRCLVAKVMVRFVAGCTLSTHFLVLFNACVAVSLIVSTAARFALWLACLTLCITWFRALGCLATKVVTTHAAVAEVGTTHAAVAEVITTHAAVAEVITTHAAGALVITTHAAMDEVITAHAAMAIVITTHAAVAEVITTHAARALVITTHASMAKVITAHAAVAEVITTHTAVAEVITTHAAGALVITTHAAVAEVITAHAAVPEVITTHASLATARHAAHAAGVITPMAWVVLQGELLANE